MARNSDIFLGFNYNLHFKLLPGVILFLSTISIFLFLFFTPKMLH